MSWKAKKLLNSRLAKENGYYLFPRGVRSNVALVYPNSYSIGMSNLGIHIIYDLLNKRTDTFCERFFLPGEKEKEIYFTEKASLRSLETQTIMSEFPLIAFAVSFEMDYFNILEILRLGKVKILSCERSEKDPIVIAGGPCATFNPEPLVPFIDAFIIGEGEEIVPSFMDTFYEAKANGRTRLEILEELSKINGIYVPSLYEHNYDENGYIKKITVTKDFVSEKVTRQWVKNLDEFPAHTVVFTEDTELRLYLLETSRGCGRHCRFCMAGYAFRKPRNRSLAILREEFLKAKHIKKKIGLMGAAISDYPYINELCTQIMDEEMKLSVASFRADSVTKKLVESLAKSGTKTLTIAPEAGSKKMRAVINKGIEEEHVFKTLELGLDAGIKHFRLYMMIGLPYEEKEDVFAIIDLVERMRNYMRGRVKGARLTVSVNPFVPKPFTPFQWFPMLAKKEIESRLLMLRNAFKGKGDIELLTESVKEAILQAILARGDRRIGDAIYLAYQMGGKKHFKKAMKELSLKEDFYIYRQKGEEEILPWDTINIGVTKEYLRKEYKNAEKEEFSIPCFDGCSRCGVCQ